MSPSQKHQTIEIEDPKYDILNDQFVSDNINYDIDNENKMLIETSRSDSVFLSPYIYFRLKYGNVN